jgi:hypothetical protein
MLTWGIELIHIPIINMDMCSSPLFIPCRTTQHGMNSKSPRCRTQVNETSQSAPAGSNTYAGFTFCKKILAKPSPLNQTHNWGLEG